MPPLSVPEYIRTLRPYVPGKPIEETQREYRLKRVIKLASNENPLGPSPKAVRAIQKDLRELHRYPDSAAFHLKAALAKNLRCGSDEILVGNGSNEIIDMLVRTYCVAGDAIVTSKAAFVAYRICAQIHGVSTIESALTSDLRTDLKAMAEAVIENPRANVVFLANPNNPTGTYNTADEVRAFLAEMRAIRGGSVLVVLDYAYWEYVTAKDLPDPMKLRAEYPNLVILRTFSKVYGLAGLRVGYAVSSPEILRDVEKVRQPFNLNSLALVGATAALGDQAFVKRARKVNTEGMKFWEAALKRLGIPFWPSQGNFLLCDVRTPFGRTGPELYEACLRRGVIFRPVANYGLADALRISVGTMAENRLAVQALEAELPTVHPALKAERALKKAPKLSLKNAARGKR